MPISKKNKILGYISFSSRLILGIVFLFSGISKIFDLPGFRWALMEIKFFGWPFVLFVSTAIIIAEISIGLLLLTGLFIRFASFHLAIFIIVLFGVSIFAMTHGNPGECNCLGKVINLSYGIPHLILLAALFILDCFVFFDRERFFSLHKILNKTRYKYLLKRG